MCSYQRAPVPADPVVDWICLSAALLALAPVWVALSPIWVPALVGWGVWRLVHRWRGRTRA